MSTNYTELPPANYTVFYKMRLRAKYNSPIKINPNIHGQFKITFSSRDEKQVGFIKNENLENLTSEHWTWVPVFAKNVENSPLFQLKIFDRENVKVDFFNENPDWTSGLAWHGITFCASKIPEHDPNCKCGRKCSVPAPQPETKNSDFSGIFSKLLNFFK